MNFVIFHLDNYYTEQRTITVFNSIHLLKFYKITCFWLSLKVRQYFISIRVAIDLFGVCRRYYDHVSALRSQLQ